MLRAARPEVAPSGSKQALMVFKVHGALGQAAQLGRVEDGNRLRDAEEGGASCHDAAAVGDVVTRLALALVRGQLQGQ